MTDYDGYQIVGPTFFPITTVNALELDEINITIPNFDGLLPITTSALELDEINITIPNFNNLLPTIAYALELDEVIGNQIVKNLGVLNEVPYYHLRAQDSGLTAPGFVFWDSYKADYTDSPTPTGSYSNLSVIQSEIVPIIKYS